MASRLNPLSEMECRQLLERILSSSQLRQAPRLCQFLTHITDCALSGRPEQATEASIGRAVFGRPDDYNPNEDGIVRSEAQQLRANLEQYFATDGCQEPAILEVPDGEYLPVFSKRPVLSSNSEDAGITGGLSWLRPLVPASFLLGVMVCGALYFQNRVLSHRLETRNSPSAAPASWLWDGMFGAGHDTTIVVADSGVVELQDIEKRNLTLDQYLQPSGGVWESADPKRQRLLRRIASRQLTSMADVVLSAEILGIGRGYPGRARIEFARKMELRDFKGRNNVVLLGDSRSNPWVELFEAPMNYRFEYEPVSNTSTVRNRAPLPGEPSLYTATGREATTGDTFGVIGFHPNLTGEGRVLLIAGATVEGTQAAGEFLINPSYAKRLSDALIRSRVPANGFFEALIKARRGPGTSGDSELLACRPLIPGRAPK